MTGDEVGSGTAAEDEVVRLCSELIRIDTTNTADPETLVGEREAAQYVAAQLTEVGYEVEVVESGADRRDNVFVRLAGADPDRDALLVHGHLDVVPADPSEWSVHPFSGAVQDGYVWGRGAVDMKDMVAMMIAVARRFRREGIVPPRDIVFAFLADEEAGGAFGAHWLVANRPDLFAGCTEAVGEVGGFSLTVAEDQRVYLIESAEKGIAWMRLRARGRPGHGSFLHDDNAVTKVAEAVARLGNHTFPLTLTDTVRAFLEQMSEITGLEFPEDDLEGSLRKLGPLSRIVGATVRDTANPTMLKAGYKANVIPSSAEAVVDCRVLPGRQEAFLREVDELIGPDVTREWVTDLPPVETTFDGPLVDAMAAALRAEDPGARTVPYMLSGGTDAKAFIELGMRCFGFSPLRLPPDLDFASLFHGIDERVPVDALKFGTRVLERFLLSELIPDPPLPSIRGVVCMDLSNKVALVTGGGSGIGAASSRLLAAAGATVAVIDLDESGAKTVADEIGGIAIPGDVSAPDAMNAIVAQVEEQFGRLDIAYLNAGITAGQRGIEDLDLEKYRKIMGVNVDHVVFGLTAAVPALRRAGGGSIIATASLAGLVPAPGDSIYTLTKHAVVGYVRASASLLAGEGIRVNAVCPGFADTPLIAAAKDRFEGFPLLTAQDVANAVQDILERGEPGECWYVQPGREPAPYGFRGVPGPAGHQRPPSGASENV